MTDPVDASLVPGTADSVWSGAIQWEDGGVWFTPWRLKPDDPGLVANPGLAGVAESAAAVRAEFESDASRLLLRIERPAEASGAVDLIVDGRLAERAEVLPGAQTLQFVLPDGDKRIELWLPQADTTRVGALETVDAHYIRRTGIDRPRWVAYGSSITQCHAASGPSATWPAVVARELGWDLTCLGFSGQCFLDDLVAQTIADSVADVVSICAGINIYNRGEWDAAELTAALERFLATILGGHPHTSIWLISPVISPSREDTVNAAGLTLRDVRSIIQKVAASFELRGVRYIDGLSVLGPDDSGLLHDGLHPSAAGYLMMAQRLTPTLCDTTL